ncbi:hypothetical protein BDW71DRAFT_171384 [Aspergillus fruticulosus]
MQCDHRGDIGVIPYELQAWILLSSIASCAGLGLSITLRIGVGYTTRSFGVWGAGALTQWPPSPALGLRLSPSSKGSTEVCHRVQDT